MKFYKKSSLFLSHLDLRVFDMVLDQMARGMLEKYIDRVIRGIPYLMSRFRKKDVKDILQYGNEEDFLYGTVYGAIVWGSRSIGQRTQRRAHWQAARASLISSYDSCSP
jgi:hypothetical protein